MSLGRQAVVEVAEVRKLENGIVTLGTLRAVTKSRRLGQSFKKKLQMPSAFELIKIFLSKKLEENLCDFKKENLYCTL